MIIDCSTRVPFPRPLVFRTYRDKLLELVPYLPNIRQIEPKSRRDTDHGVNCVVVWHGGGEIPPLARAILSEDMLSWTEHEFWNETDFTLEWQIQTHSFTKAVYCGGKNRFIATDGGTIIENRGKLEIDPQKIEGIPHFLVAQTAKIVEEFLGQKIGPNLQQMGTGVSRYLTQHQP